LFDQILEAAATEFAALAPSSSRFVSASLTEVLSARLKPRPRSMKTVAEPPKVLINFSRSSWRPGLPVLMRFSAASIDS
jgi:hypothetical protein